MTIWQTFMVIWFLFGTWDADHLRSVTCHMKSHSVTCHQTQVNTPALTPARQAGTQFTCPGGIEGWVDQRVYWCPDALSIRRFNGRARQYLPKLWHIDTELFSCTAYDSQLLTAASLCCFCKTLTLNIFLRLHTIGQFFCVRDIFAQNRFW